MSVQKRSSLKIYIKTIQYLCYFTKCYQILEVDTYGDTYIESVTKSYNSFLFKVPHYL